MEFEEDDDTAENMQLLSNEEEEDNGHHSNANRLHAGTGGSSKLRSRPVAQTSQQNSSVQRRVQ
jgi:hypothetical protein